MRDGDSRSGATVEGGENDDIDIDEGNTNSQIVATLGAGSYTIEATTYAEGETGSFTLSVSGGVAGETPVATGCDPAPLTLPASGVSGSWANDCQSQVSGRGYARYYGFALAEESQVTIDLTSSVDTYLYLWSGDVTSGTALHEDDDGGDGTNSRIVATLEAGDYTIEATTYATGATGEFTLTVAGLGGVAPTPPGEDDCGETLSGDGSTSGTWADGCESEESGRGYARYYSFTLSSEAEVTIDLESSVDTYLYLREGSETSGTALHSNDDGGDGTDSRIVATLEAGDYTIEATTYAEGQTGSFTLTVSGLGGGT